MKGKSWKKVIVSFVLAFTLAFAGTAAIPAIAPASVEVQAATIKINRTKLTLYVKKSATLKISGTSKKVTWTSSNKAVAKVSSAGKVTAVKKGTAVITGKVGSKKFTCKVTVKNPTLSATTAAVRVGNTKQLKVSNAVGTVKWASSNSAIVRVNSKGLMRGLKVGTATVTATASGVKLKCKVTVKPVPVTAVALNKTAASLIIGTKLTLKATVSPSNATNQKVTWTSSNTAVATVTSAGVVTAKSVGAATITVKTADGAKTATCKITVKPIAVTGVVLDVSSVRMDIGDTCALTATVSPSNATDQTVIWSSSNEDAASVSADGIVTANAAGKATIIAETADGGMQASCQITVLKPASEDSLPVCLASEPYTLDPALNSSVDGATMISHMFSGLAKWAQKPDGTLELVPDMAEALVDPVDNGDGTFTYTYTLRDALWSDGQSVTAQDFVYAWQRASSPSTEADYGYLYEAVNGFSWENDGTLNIRALDEKTFEVTTNGRYAYWNELLAFPTFFPVREDVVTANENWAADPETYISNGAYTMTTWDHDNVIIITKNELYPDAEEITMPEIQFYLANEPEAMMTGFQSGDFLMIDDVDLGQIPLDDPELYTQGQLGTYYCAWNVNQDLSPVGGEALSAEEQAEVRNALNSLIDRAHIVNDITKAGQVPASSFVAMGITQPDGTEFYQAAGYDPSYIGYYPVDAAGMQASYEQAMDVLAKYYTMVDGKVTDFPELIYLTNEQPMHEMIAAYLQEVFANVGINMSITSSRWDEFQNLIELGNFSIVRSGWIADYNDALSFLDLFTSHSGNNASGLGNGAHATTEFTVVLQDLGYEDLQGTWEETYDELIRLIANETDLEIRNTMLHKAEDLLMQTGCVCPLYFYTDLYMLSGKVSGFYATATGAKFFMHTTINQ